MDLYSEKVMLMAESIQEEADRMAYQQWKTMKVAIVQSICDFNLFWLRDVSPLICTPVVIDFMRDNITMFKRKLSVKEFLMADLLIKMYEPSNFEEFRIMFSNYRNDPELFNNLLKKANNQ